METSVTEVRSVVELKSSGEFVTARNVVAA